LSIKHDARQCTTIIYRDEKADLWLQLDFLTGTFSDDYGNTSKTVDDN